MGDRGSRFTILKHLASGGMADVLLARTEGIEGFERHIVVKRIRGEFAHDQSFVTMFLDEARVAASLHHQNIVQVHDIGSTNGEYFFTMEYLHGEDLRALLGAIEMTYTPMPIGFALAVVTAVASGLHYAHEKRTPDGQPMNIVHRDVTPSNILIGYDGSVKIVDFGVAKAATRQTETKAGSLKGKLSYMSPEQCRGAQIDCRTDVFALGICLYEMLTMRRLFKSDSDYVVMNAIVTGEIPPILSVRPDLPPMLAEIVHTALALDPAQRFATTDALRLALDQFALRNNLTTTTSALATYMQSVFGNKPEPWVGEARHSFSNIPRQDATSMETITNGQLRQWAAATPATGAPVVPPQQQRESRTSIRFGFEQQSQAIGLPPPPAAPKSKGKWVAIAALPVLAIGGIVAWKASTTSPTKTEDGPKVVAAVVTPPPAAVPAPAAPVAPSKVDIELDADAPNAHVVFRRRVAATPMKTEINPSDIVELVEVTAPGYRTAKFWLTFDRATHLKAHLAKGGGFEEATEEQTLVALGEIAAAPAAAQPAIAAAPVAAPVAPVTKRRIGHAIEAEAQAPAEPSKPITEAAKAAPVVASSPAPVVAPPAAVAPSAPATPSPPSAPTVITPAQLRALQASSLSIDLPSTVAVQMSRDSKKAASAAFKVCIGTGGEVSSAALMKSSGYTMFDDQALAGVRASKYHPFTVDGHPATACSAVVVSAAIK